MLRSIIDQQSFVVDLIRAVARAFLPRIWPDNTSVDGINS